MTDQVGTVGAVILAAGRSSRMGQPKLILPWGSTTVIGQVISVLIETEIAPIIVVTGGARQEVTKAVAGYPVRVVFNPDFAESEMVASLQVGLRSIPTEVTAVLVVLGDQPLIEAGVVQTVVQGYQETGAGLVVPSFQMRRGHPWLVHRRFWDPIHRLSSKETLRDFLNTNEREISYVNVGTPGILKDVDTPEDYREQAPRTPGVQGE